MLDWILLGVSLPLIFAGTLWRRSIDKKLDPNALPKKSDKHNKTFATALIAFGGFLFLTRIIDFIFGLRESSL